MGEILTGQTSFRRNLHDRFDPVDCSTNAKCDWDSIEQVTALALRDARRQRGLSQNDLAELLGVSQSRISAWERGYDPIPRRARLRLIDIMLNKRGVLDVLIKRLIEGDPRVAVHLPIYTDGLSDFLWLHVSPLPELERVAPVAEFIGRRVSDYFDLGWCQENCLKQPRRENVLIDIERDVTTNEAHGARRMHRVRSSNIFVEFEGYPKLMIARHVLIPLQGALPPKIHNTLFLDQLDA